MDLKTKATIVIIAGIVILLAALAIVKVLKRKSSARYVEPGGYVPEPSEYPEISDDLGDRAPRRRRRGHGDSTVGPQRDRHTSDYGDDDTLTPPNGFALPVQSQGGYPSQYTGHNYDRIDDREIEVPPFMQRHTEPTAPEARLADLGSGEVYTPSWVQQETGSGSDRHTDTSSAGSYTAPAQPQQTYQPDPGPSSSPSQTD